MSILRFLAASLFCVGAHGISIATFHDDEDEEKLKDICGKLAEGSCIAWGKPDDGGLAFITLSDTGTEEMIDYLKKNGGDTLDTVKVEPTQQFSVLNVDGQDPRHPKLSWGLDRIDQRTGGKKELDGKYRPGLELVPNWSSFYGEGVHVYVVDTGIRTDHKAFGGRAVPTIDTTNGKVEVCAPDDPYCARDTSKDGHGTHVAGTVGGDEWQHGQGTVVGVAPGVTLHAVKVLEERHGETHNLMPAFDWIMRNAKRPAVIQMSLGSVAKKEKKSSPALDYAITKASSKGILTVVAAGNGRNDACLDFPANVKAAMTVAASSKDDTISSYSNYGECVDIFAPGDSILSASHRTGLGYKLMSGTSMAAPHVSGAAAIVLQQYSGIQDAAKVAKILKKVGTADVLNLRGKTAPNLLLYVGGDAPNPESRRRSTRRRNRRRVTEPPATTTTTTTQPPLVPRRRRVAPGASLEDRVRSLESLAKEQASEIASLVNRLDKCKGCSAPTNPKPTQRRRSKVGNRERRRRRRAAATTTTTTAMEDRPFRPE